MYRVVSFGALGKGGGGGGGGHHGGGGHGGGGHHGGGGGHHGGGRGRGGTTIIQSGPGWGGGWWGGDASYPYPVVVEPTCEVMDQNGRCAIFDANGRIIGFQGLGDDAAPVEASAGGNTTTWVAGGLLVALAVAAFAIEKKGPDMFRASR